MSAVEKGIGLVKLLAVFPAAVSPRPARAGAKAAEVLASDPSIVVLDVRTPEEFAEGHIKGALNIDFNGDDFEKKIAELDPAKPYLLHCAAGGRSGQALPLFEKLKFNQLYHLSSGFGGWVADGQPVEK